MPADQTAATAATVLVYSSHPQTRERVMLAIGARPARDLTVEYVEVAQPADVLRACDAGGIDLAILDGEAAPTGGMGLCRQLKDELADPLPTLVLVGRRDDAWLATWSRADAVVPHPIDAVQLVETVLSMLRGGNASLAS